MAAQRSMAIPWTVPFSHYVNKWGTTRGGGCQACERGQAGPAQLGFSTIEARNVTDRSRVERGKQREGERRAVNLSSKSKLSRLGQLADRTPQFDIWAPNATSPTETRVIFGLCLAHFNLKQTTASVPPFFPLTAKLDCEPRAKRQLPDLQPTFRP